MPPRSYCPRCLTADGDQAGFCASCGAELRPLMRVVIMPFVESGEDLDALGEHRKMVERDGVLLPSQAIGCQMHMFGGLEKPRLIVNRKEAYFAEAERMLPDIVWGILRPLGFYDIPDPSEVERVASEAADMPTELFMIIQNRYDPEYLFLPEIGYFFFRYPRPHTPGGGDDAGFAYVQVSAFLLSNRENRIVSRGSGAGLEAFDAGAEPVDENFSLPLATQFEVMRRAGTRAAENLLKAMRMAR